MNLNTTDHDIEAWFAESGLVATVVPRCPSSACEVCATADLAAAA